LHTTALILQFCRGDQFAAKAAGHELKALMRFYGLVDGLHVPLMCLVDYRGFRLIAISILPIHKGTLVYGSDDCGATIWKCNKKFSELMSVAGDKLNLKKHVSGHDGTARKRKIYGPGGMSQLSSPKLKFSRTSNFNLTDIEGHMGHDGKCYLVDMARVFPPVAPPWAYEDGQSALSAKGDRKKHKKKRRGKSGRSFLKGKSDKAPALKEKDKEGEKDRGRPKKMKLEKSGKMKVRGKKGKRSRKEKASWLADIRPVHLYRLFRPEFLTIYAVPLSSDTFSGLGLHNKREHEAEIKEAGK